MLSENKNRLDNDYSRFVRQRRNLLIASFVIIIYQYANLSPNQFNFIGNIIDIRNPEVIFNILIIIFGWFLLRYYQACHDIGAKTEIVNYYVPSINKAIYDQAHKMMKKYTKGEAGSYVLNQINNKAEADNSLFYKEGADYVIKRIDNFNNVDTEYPNIEIRGLTLIRLKISTVYYMFMKKSFFTEYVFPYVMAFIGFIVCIQYLYASFF